MRSRIIIGLLLIILCAGFLLDKLDILNFSDLLSDWWALIFVIIGLLHLFKRNRGSALPGLFFILRGVVLLGRKVADINVLEYFWPVLIIVIDRKSTRLNSSHVSISYAVFCLKKNTSSPR